MPKNTLIRLPLQSRGALVSRHHVLSLTVMVLHFAAVTPTHHCKEIGELDLSPKATFPRLTDSCMELMNRPSEGRVTVWEATGLGGKRHVASLVSSSVERAA